MFDRKCKIIFICHGATIYTNQNRLYDIDDYPPINEEGKGEIEKIANWLKFSNPNIDMIYTSSSLRSIQSARIIAKNLRKDFDILDDFYERRIGVWGGLNLKQIEEKYPEMLEQYRKKTCDFCPEGGESTDNLNKRVKNIINLIIKKNIQKRIIIITHPGIIRSAISLTIGVPNEYQERIYIPTGSATQINYYSEWSSLVYSAYVSLNGA
ncbi:MAG: histidine phosphatase family protein [bacterium]